MSVKVQFELGHVAALKPVVGLNGFTHDWELSLRGIDGADISQYVEKVVFTLHESFPKPKRGELSLWRPPFIQVGRYSLYVFCSQYSKSRRTR